MSGPQAPPQRLRHPGWQRLALLIVLTAAFAVAVLHHGTAANGLSGPLVPAEVAATGAGHGPASTGHHAEHPAGTVTGAQLTRPARTRSRQAPLRVRAHSALPRLLDRMLPRRGPPAAHPRQQRRATTGPALAQLCVCQV